MDILHLAAPYRNVPVTFALYVMKHRGYLAWAGAMAAIAGSFAAGVRVGAEWGVEEFGRMDSSAKASVLASELRVLRAGNGEKLIQTKEMELDGAVAQAISFQESGKPWLFWPDDSAWNHERSLKRVAQYRRQYPPVVPDVAPPIEQPDPADLRGFGEDVKRSTQVLIERYGQ